VPGNVSKVFVEFASVRFDAESVAKAHLYLAVHIHTVSSKGAFLYEQELIERIALQMLAESNRVKSGVACILSFCCGHMSKFYIGPEFTLLGVGHSQYICSKRILQQFWCQHESSDIMATRS
jgi:hypothetical protein